MAKRKRSKQFKDSSQVIDIEEARRKRQEQRSRQHKKGRMNQPPVSDRPVRTSIKQAKKRRSIIYAAIIFAIVAVIGVSVYNIFTLKQEQKEIIKQQQALKEQKAELEEELEQLNNPDYIKEQARTQLRLVLPGEKIYVPSADETDKEKETENGN